LTVFKPRQSQRTPADGPRTQQWCRFGIGENLRNWIGEVFRNFRELGVSAVYITTSGLECLAKVFLTGPAVPAPTAGGMNPRDADPVADSKSSRPRTVLYDPAHHLVSQYHRKSGWRRAPLDFIQFGVTHTAGGHLDQHLLVARQRLGHLDRHQRCLVLRKVADLLQDHGFHEAILPKNSGALKGLN
jgi:hypothetical protein